MNDSPTPPTHPTPAARRPTDPPNASDPLLLTLSGQDRPGLTAAIFDALSGAVLDVEQTVIGGHLVQMVLLDPQGDELRLRAMAGSLAAELELELDIAVAPGGRITRREHRQRVVVLAEPLRPDAVAAVARAIRDTGGNIERISRVAAYPVTAVEIIVIGSQSDDLRRSMAAIAAGSGVDISVQGVGIDRFGRRLVVLDVDSTFIRDEVIELLAGHMGTQEQVAAITERAMRGELDFAESLIERVALLAGAPATVLDEVRGQVRLTRGARTLCRTLLGLGHEVALVSGGFAEVVTPIAAGLGVTRVRANTLEIADGVLTGRVAGPIIDRAAKAAALREFAGELGIPMARTVAIGDGANDLDMLAAAGLGVAFNAKPVVRQAADTALNVPFLDSILFLMGMTREEIEAAEESGDLPRPAQS